MDKDMDIILEPEKDVCARLGITEYQYRSMLWDGSLQFNPDVDTGIAYAEIHLPNGAILGRIDKEAQRAREERKRAEEARREAARHSLWNYIRIGEVEGFGANLILLIPRLILLPVNVGRWAWYTLNKGFENYLRNAPPRLADEGPFADFEWFDPCTKERVDWMFGDILKKKH